MHVNIHEISCLRNNRFSKLIVRAPIKIHAHASYRKNSPLHYLVTQEAIHSME